MGLRNNSAALAATAALAVLLASACGTGDSEPDAGTSSEADATEEVADSASEPSESAEAGGGEITSADYDQHDGSGVDFEVDYSPISDHGLEVIVDFNLQGSVERNKGNVVRAVSHAMDEHPDYDLIIVRGNSDGSDYSSTGATLIEAWYMPENVDDLDLENPDQPGAYEHCYSCNVVGGHHS